MAASVLVFGCSATYKPVTPTPSVIKQIGLPVYPNAKVLMANEVGEKVGTFNFDTLIVSFATADDIPKVASFYAQRLPQARQRSLPFSRGVQFELRTANLSGNRSVVVMPAKIGNGSLIQLTRLIAKFPSPVPTQSP